MTSLRFIKRVTVCWSSWPRFWVWVRRTIVSNTSIDNRDHGVQMTETFCGSGWSTNLPLISWVNEGVRIEVWHVKPSKVQKTIFELLVRNIQSKCYLSSIREFGGIRESLVTGNESFPSLDPWSYLRSLYSIQETKYLDLKYCVL